VNVWVLGVGCWPYSALEPSTIRILLQQPQSERESEVNMDKDSRQTIPPGPVAEKLQSSAGKQPWQEPKLTFVEPKLTNHGPLEEITAAFFSSGLPGG
jgi:hypothetical protein